MMKIIRGRYWVWCLIFAVALTQTAEAKKRRRARHRYPAPTHPVVLWARTLSESTDIEQRKVAAFKLSQYSLPIYQADVINRLIQCMKDPDVQIKVLCAKAMSHAGRQSDTEWVRKVLIEQFHADPTLRSTIVRTFIVRKDSTSTVHDLLLETLGKSKESEEQLVLLSYFESHGSGSNKFVESIALIYKQNDDIRIKRAVVKALGERGQGQEAVVSLLSECTTSRDTPLQLNCLAGLQLQARKDGRAWAAVEKTIERDDPDVLLATLDVIIVLPETPNVKITTRLVEIINQVDDSEIQEKAVLALGICGDQSEPIVNVLQKFIEQKNADEATRIAAALILGKQAASFPDKPKQLLSKCHQDEKSQSLRTACQLGLQELETRVAKKSQGNTVSTREVADTAKNPASAAPASASKKELVVETPAKD